MTRNDLVGEILATRRELRAEGTRGGTIVLTPEVLHELLQELPPMFNQGPPMELFGMRVVVTRQLPHGVDFQLVRVGEGDTPMEWFQASERDSILGSAFDVQPVKAQTFDEWLAKTTALLEEATRLRR